MMDLQPRPRFSSLATGFAIVGLVMTLIWHPVAFGVPTPRVIGASVLGLVLIGCVVATLWRSREGEMLLRQPSLLVPFGCALAARIVIDQLATWFPWLSSAMPIPLVQALLPISLAAVTMFLVTGVATAWSVSLMRHVVAGHDAYDALWPAFAAVPRRLLRALAVLALGNGVPMLSLAPFVAVPQLLLFGVLLLVPVSILWNGLAATLLVDVLGRDEAFVPAATRALRTSWSRRSEWLPWTLVLLALTGVVIPIGGISVHGDWVGGCEVCSHWLGQLRGDEASWVVDTNSALVDVACSVLAFGLRLRQVAALRRPAAA